MEFNEKLRELRKQHNLTQEVLAEKLYVTRAAISKWESGRGYPNIDTLKTISAFFSVSIDSLLSGDELLTVAEETGRERTHRYRNTVYALLDCSLVLLLILPLFGEKNNDAIIGVTLLSLRGISMYLKCLYYILVFGMTLLGSMTLIFQNRLQQLGHSIHSAFSLAFNVLGVIVFIISTQVYCACFLFALLSIKVIIRMKEK